MLEILLAAIILVGGGLLVKFILYLDNLDIRRQAAKCQKDLDREEKHEKVREI